ncbi:cupredoxin family copper-binding protein [Bosea sp. TAB14]
MAQAPLRAADAARVKIDNFTFAPGVLTVKAGATVTFQNDDDIPHVVVANDGSFRSKALDTGDSYVFTFTKPGDFPYFCALHPHMQGTITVTP